MYLNGWQRLWLVVSILWLVATMSLTGVLRFDGSTHVHSVSALLLALRISIVPIAALYCLGLGLAWVRRGFLLETE